MKHTHLIFRPCFPSTCGVCWLSVKENRTSQEKRLSDVTCCSPLVAAHAGRKPLTGTSVTLFLDLHLQIRSAGSFQISCLFDSPARQLPAAAKNLLLSSVWTTQLEVSPSESSPPSSSAHSPPVTPSPLLMFLLCLFFINVVISLPLSIMSCFKSFWFSCLIQL